MRHDKLTAIIYAVCAIFCIYLAVGKFAHGNPVMGLTYAALGVAFLVLEALYYRKSKNPEMDPELDGRRYEKADAAAAKQDVEAQMTAESGKDTQENS